MSMKKINIYTELRSIGLTHDMCDEVVELIKQIPIHIKEGITNTCVRIDNGIIIVEPINSDNDNDNINKSEIGIIDLPESLRRKDIILLHNDGSWSTGLNPRTNWIVMVDISRKMFTSKNLYLNDDIFRIKDGYYFMLCKEHFDSDMEWLVVTHDLNVHFGISKSMDKDKDIFSKIYLKNYTYIDNNGGLGVAK
jgi:hypothetical protein